MSLYLNNTTKTIQNKKIKISGSKSESNRLLILKEFFTNISLKNLSNSKDTAILTKALAETNKEINIGHTGTAMRFLTAYFASKNNKKVILTGSKRMQKRPIKILVDALTELGADITYLNEIGYPPIKINGKELTINKVSINGNVSSQYITALLLIAPSLKNGLEINLLGQITSKPYIKMTVTLLKRLGVSVDWNTNKIHVYPKKTNENTTFLIESDWSSASYYYSLIALSERGSSISLETFFKESLQGDSKLAAIYKKFGITTHFSSKGVLLHKEENFTIKKHLQFNLNDTPDIAQTIAVTCVGLGVSCGLTGLKTLKIKETDRLEALKRELQKFGAKIRITEDSIHIKPDNLTKIKNPVKIETYQDHRMAMAFAPLSLKVPLEIENPKVVDKSYPDFWKDFECVLK